MRSGSVRPALHVLGLAALSLLFASCIDLGYHVSPPPATPATASIGPAGGSLTSADGVATLTVPEGALTTAVTLGIAPATKAPSGAVLAYELTPSGTTFAVPATLRVDTSALSLPNGTTEADVRIETASSGAWKGLYTTLDAGKHTASASLAHLSTYGVLAPPLASRFVLAWVASDPIAAVTAESGTAAYQDGATVKTATVAAPTTPSCAPGNWLGNASFYDAAGVQGAAEAPPSSATPFPASSQEVFAVFGTGTGFSVSTKIHAQAAANGIAYAGYTAGDTGPIGPAIVAEIDNPSGTQRTVSLHWAASGSFDGTASDTLNAAHGTVYVDDYFQTANGACSGHPEQTFQSPKAPAFDPVQGSVSLVVPSGAVKIWVQVRSYAAVDMVYPPYQLKAALADELDVQIE